MKKIFNINQWLKYIDWAILGFLIFLFGCIAWIVLQTLVHSGWHIEFSVDGIKGMQRFWLEYKSLVIMFGYTLTLFIASHNLSKYVDSETVNALARLRELLNTPEKKRIHSYLMSDKTPIIGRLDKGNVDYSCHHSNVEVLDYLGTIELGIIMRERGVITPKEFESQFGYRIENIWQDEQIVRHIMENRDYYEYLLKTLKKKK